MTAPILPTATNLVTAAIDAIVAARPSTLRHFNDPSSNWYTLPTLWRAQAVVVLARLASEVKSARLDFAAEVSDAALRSLAASEFDTVLATAAQTAAGTLTLQRPTPPVTTPPQPTPPAGLIKAGTRFTKNAAPTAAPLPVSAAQYVAASTVYVPENVGVAGGFNPLAPLGLPDTVLVPVTATTSGVGANTPRFTGQAAPGQLITPAAPLFDATFAVLEGYASGGSSGLTNPVLIAAAKAYAIGQFGPTAGAAIAGALRQQSVRHYAAFPAGALPYGTMYLADESWASEARWVSAVAQAVATDWLGFGCRMRFGQVVNQQIAVAPTIVLASSDDLDSTDAIDANVRAVAESYFNDRPDWWRFSAAALQAVLSKADARILRCSGVTVTDVVTGSPVPDTTVAPQTSRTFVPTLTHWFLTDSNCTASYLPPA